MISRFTYQEKIINYFDTRLGRNAKLYTVPASPMGGFLCIKLLKTEYFAFWTVGRTKQVI